MALAVVQRDAALEVGQGPSYLAHRHEGRPQGVVGLEELPAVVAPPGGLEQTLAGRHGGRVVAPREADVPEPPQDEEPARGVVEPLHQRKRGEIRRLHERRRRPVHRDHGSAERDAHVEGIGQRLARLGQLGEERQRALEEIDGLRFAARAAAFAPASRR